MSQLKLPPYQKSQRKSYAGFPTTSSPSSQLQSSNFASSFQLIVTAPASTLTGPQAMSSSSCDKIPGGYVSMDHQVAGHTFQVGTDQIGMLKSIDDGSVLKPGGSPMCASREIKFYEQLLTTTDPSILPLQDFVSEYRGVLTLPVGNKTLKFIKLRDLTHQMPEPCVIDLKIGLRTWDPMATPEKQQTEDGKYKLCKATVGFCIPGFQTFHIASGDYKKFGKEYGKKLNKSTVVDALSLFLNADSGLSRQLVTSILSKLWAIQKWMQTQKTFQFYSSSILIVYDARKLRQVLETKERQSTSQNALELNNGNVSPNGGELTPTRGLKKNDLGGSGEALSDPSKTPPPTSVYKKIQRSHSANNNYDQEMRKMKYNYQQMLDNLVGAYDDNKEWVHVKMIDFAHTFSNSELSDGQVITGLDSNYLHGIDNLVRIFEEFLKKCDT